MNMKKIAPAAMSALLFGSALVPVASANEQQSTEAEVPQIQIDPVHIFNDTRGTVEDVRIGENITYYTVKEGEQTNVLEITKDTLVFDNTGKKVELQKGDRVLADILKLNIAKETVLLNEKGVKVDAKDLAEKHLVVFYTASTKSIPAQTTPSKVIVLDDDSSTTKNPILEEIDNIIASDSYEVAGTKMVPLRVIAEKLGFKVDSTGKGAILSKGNMSYTITRGEKTFGYNKALRTLTVAPTLKETKTYVPVEFVDEYLK